MADLSISEQYDNQVGLLENYYDVFNDDDKIDEMVVADVMQLVKNIYDTEVILDFLDKAGVRGGRSRERIVTNVEKFTNKYQDNGGLTIFEEDANNRKRNMAKNKKRNRRGIFLHW